MEQENDGMSILIRGMEMPKNCDTCFVRVIRCKLYLHGRKHRHPDCPLVPVPEPHGELVDRAELLAEYDRRHKGPAGGARAIMEKATTIVEAEGSEK